jgi:hypothetical protein
MSCWKFLCWSKRKYIFTFLVIAFCSHVFLLYRNVTFLLFVQLGLIPQEQERILVLIVR